MSISVELKNSNNHGFVDVTLGVYKAARLLIGP